MSDEQNVIPSPDLFEGMTAISALLDPAVAAFNDRRVTAVFVDKAKVEKKAREVALLRHKARELGFTVQEVKEIGHVLGLPADLVEKTPIDGLCGKSDEENLGFT